MTETMVTGWENKRLATVNETAHCLGLSPYTIRSWIQKGRIETNKQGRRRLIPTAEIDRLIEEGRIPARADAQ